MKTTANRLTGVLLLGLIIVLSSSCSSSYEAPTSYEPPTSYEAPEDSPNQSAGQYPAEISGKVIVAEKLQQGTAIPVAPSDENRVYWLQEITIKNVSYPDPIEAYISGGGGWTKWRLVYNDDEYAWTHITDDIHIDRGETTTFWTYCTMPRYLEISDVQIRYIGQEPYSYGDLTLVDEVEAYDWYTKKSIPEGATEEEITQGKAIVIDNWQIQLVSSSWSGSTLNVNLVITNLGDRRNFGFP